MTSKKRAPSMDITAMSMSEALARFIGTKPSELDETLANSMLEREARVRERVRATREEIEDGGRPRKGRFRL